MNRHDGECCARRLTAEEQATSCSHTSREKASIINSADLFRCGVRDLHCRELVTELSKGPGDPRCSKYQKRAD